MKSCRKYGAVFLISLQNAFHYRSNVLGGLVFYTLFIFVFFNLWRAIYQGGSVAGYSLAQVVWYLCITELIVFGAKTDIFARMNEEIKSGSIAYQLSRPYNYVFYQFFQALGGIVFNYLLYGLLAVALGIVMAGPLEGFNPATAPFALLSALVGLIINFFFQMALGLTAFRLEENLAVYLIYQKLVFMLGMFIPLEFLPAWLQAVARRLPFSYVAWAPARLTVAFSWDFFLEVFPVQLLWAAVSILFALLMYRLNVAALQGHGG
ncbi:MAG TPA: hypothetical protein GX699_09230 [Firmicutes bacterium]|nr:hypothetical protein [Bacillota bacterium]